VSSSSDRPAGARAGHDEPAFGPELLARLTTLVVGRRRELEAVVAALAAGRHLLLEGPPGTGKSTVLRGIAEAAHIGFEFVEGNAELTPARLVGTFDPAAVLSEGYVPEVFVDGPLLNALRDGSLLYVEEINRVPEETLNVLITVMSEGELNVPRLGRVHAAPGFRLVAAMNPFDAVGTARIASAVYDRCCRLAMGYQSAAEEAEIVRAATGTAATGTAATGTAATAAERVCDAHLAATVAMVRASRVHGDVRTGSSVRGAIDHVLLCAELAGLRGLPADDPSVTLDAALLALSGRLRLREGTARTPEEVVEELWAASFTPAGEAGEPDGDGGAEPGKG
jgi:MoxR-like ATPase